MGEEKISASGKDRKRNLDSREKYLDYFRSNAPPNFSYSMQLDSSIEGAHIVVVAGTHGDEPSGVQAAIDVHDSITSRKVLLKKGKITFILGNPQAFEIGERYVDEDLNRAFTDSNSRTSEGRRAQEIRRFIHASEKITSVLDLHSVSRGNHQIVAYNIGNKNSFELARQISIIETHLAYYSEHIPGLLLDEFGRYGCDALAIECGNHKADDAVEVALDHIYSLLVRYALIDRRQAKNSLVSDQKGKVLQYETLLPIVPGKNFRFLISNLTTGTKLSEGEIYAMDDDRHHIAPSDCFLVVPSEKVRRTDRDAGFLCKLNIIYKLG